MRVLAAAAVALGLALALALCSRLPFAVETRDDARIRLSWRALPERIEECREPSAEELAKLPPHMRRPRICEGRTLPFLLQVTLDGETRLDARIQPAGVRGERPAYVFRELRVAPGEHRLTVRFAAQPDGPAPQGLRAPLVLEETVRLAPGSVLLVTYDPDTDRLRIRTSG